MAAKSQIKKSDLNGLVNCSVGDENFKSLLANANLATITAALAEVEKRPAGNKQRLRSLQSALKNFQASTPAKTPRSRRRSKSQQKPEQEQEPLESLPEQEQEPGDTLEGDYVKGKNSEGHIVEGIVTAEGRTYLRIGKRAHVVKESAEVVEIGVCGLDCLRLVGLSQVEQVDEFLGDFYFSNTNRFPNDLRVPEDLGILETYKGWGISLKWQESETFEDLKYLTLTNHDHIWEAEGDRHPYANQDDAIEFLHNLIDDLELALSQANWKPDTNPNGNGESVLTPARKEGQPSSMSQQGIAHLIASVPMTPEEAKAIAVEGDSCPIDQQQQPEPSTNGKREPLKGDQLAIVSYSPVEAEIVPEPKAWLEQLEAEIEAGRELIEQGESRIWKAAYTIQRVQLWKEAGFTKFEEYCQQRWGWKRSNSFDVAKAGKVVEQLQQSGVPDNLIPQSVTAALEVAKVPEEKRIEVLGAAIESNGKLTAESIKQAAGAVKPDLSNPETWKSRESLEAAGVQFEEADQSLFEQPQPEPEPETEEAETEEAETEEAETFSRRSPNWTDEQARAVAEKSIEYHFAGLLKLLSPKDAVIRLLQQCGESDRIAIADLLIDEA